jgi:SAM-dependent methyltransferase
MAESDFLQTTRQGYDATAAEYAERFHRHLDGKPLDRAVLTGFGGLVSASEKHPVIDVGCGTGCVTEILNDLGVPTHGVDLSPGMVAEARRINPALRFEVGSMTKLDIETGTVAGVVAWYSTIHIPDDHLDAVFTEFARVLVPGGHLLVAFQVGDTPRHLTDAFGHSVSLTFHRRQPEEVVTRLERAGFTMRARMLRERDDDGFESTPQAFLVASAAESRSD